MKLVVVIGSGPAGMMAALAAAQNGAQVTLLEQNEKTGKKLYISGKGRCNITNDCSVQEFLQNVVTNPRFLMSALHKFSPADTVEFCRANGLTVKTERGNRVFPVSDKSSDVIKTFNRALEKAAVNVQLNTRVTSVQRASAGGAANDGFVVTAQHTQTGATQTLNCHSVIVATGGFSYRTTGSTGFGYKVAEAFNHPVIPLKPALCRILCGGTSALEGLSLKNVEVSYTDPNGKMRASEFGEMLFTDDGVSGPAVLSLSCHINRIAQPGGHICLDLKPALDAETLNARVLRDFAERMNKNFANALDGLLPERLTAEVVAQSGISPAKKVNQITAAERTRLVQTLKCLRFPFVALDDINNAIVTSGGVDVKTVNPSTMESKLCPNLYFCGELLDVDAYTGGFSIQIALSTGHLAGANAALAQ